MAQCVKQKGLPPLRFAGVMPDGIHPKGSADRREWKEKAVEVWETPSQEKNSTRNEEKENERETPTRKESPTCSRIDAEPLDGEKAEETRRGGRYGEQRSDDGKRRSSVAASQQNEIIEAETNEFRKANQVTVRGRGVPTPILGLYDAYFPECVAEAAYALSYGPLTALQSQCWPVALHGRDLLAIAHTLAPANEQAYLLPAIVHALHQPVRSTGHGPVVLVLVPNREVAEKIQRLVSDLEKYTDVRSVCLCSGDWKQRQLKRLKKASYGMWVATPSPDRMLAMGFEKTLRSIAALVRPDRQTLIFANSGSREIENLADCLINDYVQVSIGRCKLVEDKLVEQIVIIFEKAHKLERLVALLQDILREKEDKVIVFVETRLMVDEMVLELRHGDWSVVGIHGAKARDERQKALDAFKSGSSSILVLTDVAAQRLDVDRVRFVVHYDRPANADVYVNRVNCASGYDARHAKELVSHLLDSGEKIHPRLLEIAEGASRSYDAIIISNKVPLSATGQSRRRRPQRSRFFHGKCCIRPTDMWWFDMPKQERRPNWKNVQLQPFEKNLYEEHQATASRSMADVEGYRKANGVSVKGRDVPKPILALEESNFPDFIVKVIEAGWDYTNFLGIAETGSHKTLAYLLPAVIHRHEGPIAALLAPTSELAKQIHTLASELGKRTAVRSVCAANGERKKSKYAELHGGCHTFVATPRCLIEFLEEGQWKVEEITLKLRKRGRPAMSLHCKKEKKERDWILSMFNSCGESVLVTTDMAVQDLVLPDVRLVVNYDCPDCSKVYVHRSRHAQRSDEPSMVHTFLVPSQHFQARTLVEILRDARQPGSHELYELAKNVHSKR
ncbi:hypothetical protein HPB52_025203 [Rhipicephalus sanguineus]|uniref:RNA helicase n=1 Tax=Rhipicephalus sanguineus TaxID=34632 RepID=A0A9D4TDA9_RHISA|nr:hypothetical protein HPB52_025203 [Rhipicephalus sanguineus]